ncbi:M23 family metallopeptidase [Flexivirga lutea]
MGLPTGVALAATVGGVVVSGIAPMPFGGRSLAMDRGLYDASAATITTRAVQPSPVVTPQRSLPGAASRDRAPARPDTKGASAAATTATAANSKTVFETSADVWTCAVAGCAGPMVSGFGARVSPGGIGSTYHRGDDFAVAWGTALRSMHTGTVVSTGWVSGLGIHVTIDYGGGIQSVYGHMSRVEVVPGQRVSRGQLVGRSGSTGISTGPHLHLEIHLDGVAVNPTPWLRAHGIY